MVVDRHAKRRQSLTEQEQFHGGVGREGLEHTAGRRVDVSDGPPEFDARVPLDMAPQGIERVVKPLPSGYKSNNFNWL